LSGHAPSSRDQRGASRSPACQSAEVALTIWVVVPDSEASKRSTLSRTADSRGVPPRCASIHMSPAMVMCRLASTTCRSFTSRSVNGTCPSARMRRHSRAKSCLARSRLTPNLSPISLNFFPSSRRLYASLKLAALATPFRIGWIPHFPAPGPTSRPRSVVDRFVVCSLRLARRSASCAEGQLDERQTVAIRPQGRICPLSNPQHPPLHRLLHHSPIRLRLAAAE
jgi:hypothetical protein